MDCELFATADSIDLALNNRAEKIYDHVQMNDHLLKCLESGQNHPLLRFRIFYSPVVHLDITKDTSFTQKKKKTTRSSYKQPFSIASII